MTNDPIGRLRRIPKGLGPLVQAVAVSAAKTALGAAAGSRAASSVELPAVTVAREQLQRMRSMTAQYHRRFFADVWLTVIVWLAVLVAGDVGSGLAFVALPFVALFGAVITAFDASYLVFARHYSAALERFLNGRIGERVLVGADLEDEYLFPLRDRKVVTIARRFSWFGFVTVFFTALGTLGYVFGLVLALDSIVTRSAEIVFLAVLTAMTVAAFATGVWWFVSGVGERRLTDVLDPAFPAVPTGR
jgi:hypothetical protein